MRLCYVEYRPRHRLSSSQLTSSSSIHSPRASPRRLHFAIATQHERRHDARIVPIAPKPQTLCMWPLRPHSSDARTPICVAVFLGLDGECSYILISHSKLSTIGSKRNSVFFTILYVVSCFVLCTRKCLYSSHR